MIPADLVPRWRDLPRLSWVLARTYTDGPAWVASPAALVSAGLLAGPCLLVLRTADQLAGVVTTRAASVAVPDSRSRAAVLAGVVGLLLAYGLTSAVALAAGMTALALLPTNPAVAYLAALGVVAAAAAPALSALPRALRREARLPGGAPPDATVNMVGAWPQRCGAGGQIIAALVAVADVQHITLRLTARDVAAAALYQRHGFTFDQTTPSARMTRLPGSSASWPPRTVATSPLGQDGTESAR